MDESLLRRSGSMVEAMGTPLLRRSVSASVSDTPPSWRSRRLTRSGTIRALNRVVSAATPQKISAEQDMIMSPWRKCLKYRRFPTLLVLHLLLVVLVSSQSIFYTRAVQPYFVHSQKALRASFFSYVTDDGSIVRAVRHKRDTAEGDSGLFSAEVGSIADLRSSINATVYTSVAFVDNSVDDYAHATSLDLGSTCFCGKTLVKGLFPWWPVGPACCI